MERNTEATGSTTQPSAPPPTAPPSYEEAVGGLANLSINSPPYPVGSSTMPMPISHNQAPKQTMPVPPNYTAPATSPSYNPDQNFSPPPEVRIIHQHVTYVLGPNPVKMNCPMCHADIKTTTISDHQPSAHICCIVLCLVGCCLCSCLPYCMSAFMNVHHFCPNCKNYISTWKG